MPGALRTLGVLSAFALGAALIACGWYNWPSTDDFCNRALTSSVGVAGALDWLYHEWSGRLATSAILYSVVAGIEPPELHVVSAAFGAALLLVSWQIAVFVRPAERSGRIPLFAFVTAALALGLYPLLGQTVFWATGAMVYWLPLLLLMHWLRLTRDARRPGATPHRVYGVVIGVLLGNSIELVVPIALAYAGTLAAVRWRALDGPARRDAIVRIASVLLGFAILASAPGNYVRAGATPNSFALDPAFLAASYGSILRASFAASPVLPLICLALAMAGARVFIGPAPGRTSGSERLDEAAALAVGAFASLVPILAAPAQFAPRNSLYLLVTLLVAALLAFDAVRRARGAPPVSNGFAVAGVLLAIVALGRLAADVPLARAHRAEHLARDRLLRAPENAGRDVIVAPIRAPAPRTMHAIDIGSDRRELVNWCVAKYYGLDSIETGDMRR